MHSTWTSGNQNRNLGAQASDIQSHVPPQPNLEHEDGDLLGSGWDQRTVAFFFMSKLRPRETFTQLSDKCIVSSK